MRFPARSSARSAGFGLTEAMIAVGIVATALLVLVQQLSIGFRESGANEDRAFAYQKAAAMLGEIQNSIALGNIRSGDQLLALADAQRNFVLTTRKDHEGLVFLPEHPMSGNVQLGGDWRWSRRVAVEPHDSAGLYYCRVSIEVREGAMWRTAASHALLFSLQPPTDAPEQTHDVYVIACSEAPSALGDLAAMRDAVTSACSDITASSQAKLEVHWITSLGYGRDPCYVPFVNTTRPADAAAPWAYWLPGALGGAHVGKTLYHADLLQGALRTEDGMQHVAGPMAAWPVTIADRHNHCMRTPAAWRRFDQRVAAGLEDADAPPLQLLLDDLQRRPERYRNAIFLNLHGPSLPMPPLRNASDAAKDPVGRPGVRVVTHPARLWTPRDPDGNQSHSDSRDLELRVHGWRAAGGADTLAEPVLVHIYGGNFTGNVNGAGTGQPTLLVHRLPGGVSLDTGAATGEGREYSSFDSVTGKAPRERTRPFEMWFETGYVGGADPYTWIRLHNTPLVAPAIGAQGLAHQARFHGLDHCPSPVKGEFEHDLATSSSTAIVRNTARWRIRLPTTAFAAGSLQDRDQVIRIVTRIGSDGATGVRWPTSHQPLNCSETFAWWSRAPSSVPATERAQFLGDPRMCPYADLMVLGATLPGGCNANFDDLVCTGSDARALWPCLPISNFAEGFGDGVRADAGRFLQLLRDGLQAAGAIYVATGDRVADALLLGGEIATATTTATEPIALHRDFTAGSATAIDTIACARGGADGALGELALVRGDGTLWRSLPWLGELFPEDLGTAWIEDGNLPFGDGVARLSWQPLTGAMFSDLPRGTSLAGLHGSRMGPAGAAMLACCGSSSSTLVLEQVTENLLMPTTDGAVAIHQSVQSEPASTLRSSRVIKTQANSGVSVNGLDLTANFPRSTLIKVETTWTCGEKDAGASFTWASAARGAATLVLWTANAGPQGSRDHAYESLLLGLRALHAASKPAVSPKVAQVPRLQILEPKAGTLVVDPTSMTLRWSTEWLRYDGEPYTELHTPNAGGDESGLVYRAMWSLDQGATWLSATTGEAALVGEYPEDVDERLVDSGEGSESFTFALPDDTPQTELLLAVEAWRAATRSHHASHQTRVHVRRSSR